MPNEQLKLEDLVHVRRLGESWQGSTARVDLYTTSEGDYRVIKWRGNYLQAEHEASKMRDMGSKPEISDIVVKYHGLIDNPQGEKTGIVLDALVPETGFISWGSSFRGEQTVSAFFESTNKFAESLNALHKAGHPVGDLQTADVYVTKDASKLKIIDFGYSRYQNKDDMDSDLERAVSSVRGHLNGFVDSVEYGNFDMRELDLDFRYMKQIIYDNLKLFKIRNKDDGWVTIPIEEWSHSVANTTKKLREYIINADSIPEEDASNLPVYEIEVGYMQWEGCEKQIADRLQKEFGGTVLDTSYEIINSRQAPENMIGKIKLQTIGPVTEHYIRMLGDPAYASDQLGSTRPFTDPFPNHFDDLMISYATVSNVRNVG